ncbi:hypothetical protein [Kribbella sp. NPDC006257]|uniref:hypothetical protein n=1 Tax=Kribbella sp. NPDC006257 TaxID=3156738 RepID=UPI0033A681C1
MSRFVRRAVAVGVAAVAAAGGATVPAAATTQFAVDHFRVCMDEATNDCSTRVEGSITWGQRTAIVTGKVINGEGGSATAAFSAYAGSKRIDHTTRTASGVSTTPFSFVIGDPNLVGGINRISETMGVFTGQLVVPGDSKVDIRD